MTEPVPLRKRKKIRTRQAILDAAWELYRKQGFENTTLDQIADHADVHRQTLFRYFPTKHAIMLAREFDELEAFKQEMISPERSMSAIDCWRKFVSEGSRAYDSMSPEVRSDIALIYLDKSLRVHMMDVSRQLEAALIAALAQDAGTDPDTDIHAISLGAALVAANRACGVRVVTGKFQSPMEAACIETLNYIVGAFEKQRHSFPSNESQSLGATRLNSSDPVTP